MKDIIVSGDGKMLEDVARHAKCLTCYTASEYMEKHGDLDAYAIIWRQNGTDWFRDLERQGNQSRRIVLYKDGVKPSTHAHVQVAHIEGALEYLLKLVGCKGPTCEHYEGILPEREKEGRPRIQGWAQ